MKKLSIYFAVAVAVLVSTSCSKENVSITDSESVLFSTELTVQDQTPNKAYDATSLGIYHGIIASGSTQSRGKIWINMGNDSTYTAEVKLIDGSIIKFSATESLSTTSQLKKEYRFISDNAYFIIDVSDFENPVIGEAVIDRMEYFSVVGKNTSQNRMTAMTGIFVETGNPDFNGTWNVLANGATNPNGGSGFPDSNAISQVMLTFNSKMATDNIQEQFVSCLFGSPVVPELTIDGTISSAGQTSNFYGNTTWSLFRTAGNYYGNGCSPVVSGTFTRTNQAGNQTQSGEIYVD